MALPKETMDRLQKLEGWSDLDEDQRQDVIAGLESGAANMGEFMGMSKEMFNSIEMMAYNFYVAKVYIKAGQLYLFLLFMDPLRATAWRGVAACHHAAKNLKQAATYYSLAVAIDPSDIVSNVYWGECLCMGENPRKGMEILQAFLKKLGNKKVDAAFIPYVVRARGIVAAKGGFPQQIVLMETGKRVAQDAAALLQEQGAAEPNPMAQMFKTPEMQAGLAEITKAYSEGRLTIKEIAGFSDNQVDTAYAAACKYLNAGQPLQALQIIGWLIYIDSRDARFYHVGGICMQHLKMYPLADYMYSMAQMYGDEKSPDPDTMVYLGEVKILMDKRAEGLALLRDGAALAQKKSGKQETFKRAQTLIKQYGS